MKDIISKIKEFISGEDSGVSLEVSKGLFNNIIIILMASILANIISIKSLESTFIEISKNTAIILDSTIKELISGLKHISAQYSGVLGFAGSFLGGCMAILVYKLQIRNQKKQELKRLMFLTLDTYRSVKLLDLNGDLNRLRSMSDDRASEFRDKHSGLVYDKEWSKLISNISEFQDARILSKWFYCIEQMIIFTEDELQERYALVEEVLCKYGCSKELEKMNKEWESVTNTVEA